MAVEPKRPKLEVVSVASEMINNANHSVEYISPKPEAIRAFAHEVCVRLAAKTNDSKFLQPHVIRVLAEFLEISARAQAKRLNEGS